MKIYIFLVKKLIWLWDVYFTWLDNFQLRIWVKMKEHLTNVQESTKIEPYGEEYDSWEEL